MSAQIVVVGLGYVGLPLAVALASKFPTCGLDTDSTRIEELRAGFDRTNEIEIAQLAAVSLALTASPEQCPPADIFVVTVPTPVDASNTPDLGPVMSATRTIAKMLDPARKPIIVYESTVYPGVTEDVCGPELERLTGLEAGRDFFLGYSPERINPGDREHSVDRITKVVAGQTEEVTDRLADIYGAITIGGVFKARSIKVAEAAKVIENTQRDVNIALMNEISRIFGKMDISVWDVLAAANTKWNFLPFQPGLVGGHCIGVDPYYLSFRAKELGYDPAVILAGRATNDSMACYIADELHKKMDDRPGTTLILGLTFKENVPDLRNSKVVDLAARLAQLGHDVTIHDPLADEDAAQHEYGIGLNCHALESGYDMVILAVPHQAYLDLGGERLWACVKPNGVLADLKGVVGASNRPPDKAYWSL